MKIEEQAGCVESVFEYGGGLRRHLGWIAKTAAAASDDDVGPQTEAAASAAAAPTCHHT